LNDLGLVPANEGSLSASLFCNLNIKFSYLGSNSNTRTLMILSPTMSSLSPCSVSILLMALIFWLILISAIHC